MGEKEKLEKEIENFIVIREILQGEPLIGEKFKSPTKEEWAALGLATPPESCEEIERSKLIRREALLFGKAASEYKYRQNQKKFAGNRHEEDHVKHAQWQKLQAEAIAETPRIATYSKLAQAKLLKEKHGIADLVGTIRKRIKDTRRK
jgi:hypothetical protein